MASLNKVMLIGHVGREPEVRYIDNGVATAVVSLATNTPGYTLPGGTQVPERSEWHRIMLWRRLAEIVERYVHKGDQLYVEGQLRTRSYTDKKGKEHSITEIWAENLQLLTPRSQSAAPAQSAPAATAQSTPAPANNAAPAKEVEEKLPF